MYEFIDCFENRENKTVHNFINELGAQLNEDEKDMARMILNDLFLNGRDDCWICIALIRILGKGSFSQWKYLLQYQPFIEENDWLYNEYLRIPLADRLKEIDLSIGFCEELFIDLDEEDENNVEVLAELSIDRNKVSNLDSYRDIIDYYFFKVYLNPKYIRYVLELMYRNDKEITKPLDIWVNKLTETEKMLMVEEGWLNLYEGEEWIEPYL